MKKHLRKKTGIETKINYNLTSLFSLLKFLEQKALDMEKNGCPAMSLEPTIKKTKNNESNNISSGIDRGANGRILDTRTIRKGARVRKA